MYVLKFNVRIYYILLLYNQDNSIKNYNYVKQESLILNILYEA